MSGRRAVGLPLYGIGLPLYGIFLMIYGIGRLGAVTGTLVLGMVERIAAGRS